MKNKFLIIAFLITISAYAQTYTEKNLPDSLIILAQKDEMSDKTYLLTSRKVVCSNQEKTKAFTLSAFIENGYTVKDLKVDMIGIGSCVEKNEMIILFDDDSKLTLKSWNGFNCKGNAWFTITKKEIDLLSTKKLKKVRLTNGRSYESYTGDIEEKDQDYYIRLFSMLQAKQSFTLKKGE
jgi:hypothetical protein